MAVLLAISAHAQIAKPGLWETVGTVNMGGAMQLTPAQLAQLQSKGIKVPGVGGEPVKVKMCMTKEMIDKFGGSTPQRNSSCHLENIQKDSSGMKASMVCTGPTLTGSGMIEATRIDDNHAHEKVHFSGTNRAGKPMEYTAESTATFLGTDCGDIKPGQFAQE
jgi:hypothetical protein